MPVSKRRKKKPPRTSPKNRMTRRDIRALKNALDTIEEFERQEVARLESEENKEQQ